MKPELILHQMGAQTQRETNKKQDRTKSGLYLVESADGVEALFNYSYSSAFH